MSTSAPADVHGSRRAHSATDCGDARGDLRWRGDRRLHRLLPQPAAGRGGRGRAHRRRLRRLGQVGRFPGAGLVRRVPARAARPAQLRPACRACRQARREQLELPPPRYLERAGQRAAWSSAADVQRRRPAGSARARWCRASSAHRRPRRRCTRRGSPRLCCRRPSAGRTAAPGLRDGCRPRRRRTTALGIEVDGEVLEADAIVIAMGPWSMTACRWLPLPAVYGLKGNSVVFQSGGAISADALFVELTTADGEPTRRRYSRAPTARPTSAVSPASRHCRKTRPRWRPTRGLRRRCEP